MTTGTTVTSNKNTVIIPGNFYHENHSVYLAQLTKHGLQLNQDYTWQYCPNAIAKCTDELRGASLLSHTEIMFTDAKWAMYFALKWAK